VTRPHREGLLGSVLASSEAVAGVSYQEHDGGALDLTPKEILMTITVSVQDDLATDVAPEPVASTHSSAPVAVVLDFVGATLPQFDRLLLSLRLEPRVPGLPGSLFQWSRATEDGVRVTEVWKSRTHFFVALQQKILPGLAVAGLPKPEITTYDLHTYLTTGSSGNAFGRLK
jgi:hypothetical protein